MAKKINDFLKSLISKAGGNVDDEKIKTALAAITAEIELSDDLINAIEHGLISIDNAKNNHPDIKKHYTALAFNGLDAELDRLMEDEKFNEDTINEIKNEKSSTKRAALIAKKIKEAEAAKATAGKADTKVLNEKISELQGLLRAEKDSVTGIKTEYEKKLRDKDKGYAMRNILSTYQTIYDKLDPETKNITINAILDKNLRSKGYILDVDENGNLSISTKDGAAFTDDHRPLTPKIFFDKVMADENLLVVSGSNDNNNNNRNNNNNSGRNNGNNNNSGGFNNNNRNNNQNQNQNNNNGDGGGNNNSNSALKELINRSKNDIENSNKAQMF